LSFKNLRWAIYLIVFTLPAYLIRFQLGPLPMTLLEGEILILFLVWLFRLLKQLPNIKIKLPLFLYLFISLFLVSATVAVFISPNLREAAGIWKAYFIEPILFFIVFITTIKRDDLKNVLMVLCFNAFLLSIFAVYQKFTGDFIANPFWAAEATRRVTSVFPYPNALALYLAPLIILFWGYLVFEIKNSKLFQNSKFKIKNYLFLGYCLLVIVLGIFAIYFTRSKGALISILVALIFYALFFKGYRKIFMGIIVVAFISLFLYFSISQVNIINTLKGNATITNGDSITTRLDMWDETWQMLKTKPILGAGLSGYQTAVAPFHKKSYIEIYLYPHNIFLNFWSEIGLLGLLAFIGIIIWLYYMYFVTPSFSSDQSDLKVGVTIIVAAMTTLLAHGLVDVPYFKNDLAILFWLLIASLVVIMRSDSNVYNEKLI